MSVIPNAVLTGAVAAMSLDPEAVVLLSQGTERSSMFGYARFLLTLCFLCTYCLSTTIVRAADFDAIVEKDGTVALCVSNGALLFADQCQGSGRLSIVQPVKEGTVVWRSVNGTVTLGNDTSNPECALSHATWDQKHEEVVSTGRKITAVDKTDLLQRLKILTLKDADAIEEDITAFALDLDNDGTQEIVFVASNINRIADHFANDSKPIPVFISAGILPSDSNVPKLILNAHFDYAGPTDAFGDFKIKGIVPLAPGSGELALLVNTGGDDGLQKLIRYRPGLMQEIDTIEFTCN